MNSQFSLQHIGLVADTTQLSFSELGRVSAALQKQAIRDLGPIWGIQATVDAFSALEDVPVDYWPIIVRDDINTPGAAGVHLDKDGHPFALVQYSPGWSLTASHECLEMLCDPLGNRVIAGKSPMAGQGRVEFLVEVCDPPESDQFAYTVNGVMVSDFYTPHYFDPVSSSGVRYSFTGAIKKPRSVLAGGYLSWHDLKTDHWFQEVFFNEKPEFRDLGPLAQANGSIRTLIYEKTPEAFKARVPQGKPALTASQLLLEATDAGSSKAKRLRAEINELLKKK
jgi:hypothetical protein